jgi:membrane protein implicated in regulation of membrane protease activity
MEALFALLGQIEYWHWLALGLVLLVGELTTGSTYLLWPAAAAWIAGLAVLLLGIAWPAQLAVFGVSAIGLTALGRSYLRGRWLTGADVAPPNEPAARLVGQTAVAVADFAHGEGRVRLGDSEWRAVSALPVRAGEAVVVERAEGATLHVAAAPKLPGPDETPPP